MVIKTPYFIVFLYNDCDDSQFNLRMKHQQIIDEALQIIVQKTCPYCGKEFELVGEMPSQVKRSHCSQSCAAKSNLAARSDMSNPWSDEEIALLKSWIGKKPLGLIQREWKLIAKKKGWHERSDEAIHVKFGRLCRELGVSEKAKHDNLSMYELSRQLDIPFDRVREWRRLGLKAFESGIDVDGRSHVIAISRKNLREFAIFHPEQFWGIDRHKLSKALGDSKLAKHIHETVEQPTVGRTITVIRLDTGDVYRSARSAALALNLGSNGKGNILRCLQRDTPMRNGMDFARIDYPVYWVPLAIREEFNQLAGHVFYEIYLQLKDLDGYSKTSCQIVAGRMAVQITQFAFKRNLKEANKGMELTPKQITVEFWTTRFITTLKNFLELDRQQGWNKIASAIKGWAYREFYKLLPASQKQLQLHLEEYALWYIQRATEGFFKRSYLPKNYQPKNKLEIADLYTYIYGSIIASVEIRPDLVVLLVHLLTWRYKEKMGLIGRERTADLSGAGLDEDQSDRSFQYHAQSRAIAAAPNDAAQLLDDLVEFIKHQPLSNEYRDRLQLYIAMKLEDASDGEIAAAMGIGEGEVRSMEAKLKAMAVKFQKANRLAS